MSNSAYAHGSTRLKLPPGSFAAHAASAALPPTRLPALHPSTPPAEKTLRSTVALTAARGRGKSAALGLAIAGGLALGYSNIFVTAPSPENLRTLFDFVFKGLDELDYKVGAGGCWWVRGRWVGGGCWLGAGECWDV